MYKKTQSMITNSENNTGLVVGWMVWFYGISTFVGYLAPNSFL